MAIIRIISVVLNALGTWLLSAVPVARAGEPVSGNGQDAKQFSLKAVTFLSFASFLLSSLLVLLAIVWQHVAAVAQSTTVESILNGSVETKVGTVAMALGWVAFGLQVVCVLAVGIMILSIHNIHNILESLE
jgi:hypothetical protein